MRVSVSGTVNIFHIITIINSHLYFSNNILQFVDTLGIEPRLTIRSKGKWTYYFHKLYALIN